MSEDGLAGWVREAMEPLGAVRIPPAFGGHCIYLDGTIFAILGDGDLWFKSDLLADPVWDGEGCERFSFDKGNGERGVMNYRRAPSECHDDAEALRRWAGIALDASRRKAAKCRPKRRRAA